MTKTWCLISMVFVYFASACSNSPESMQQAVNYFELREDCTGIILYARARVWGIASGNSEILISKKVLFDTSKFIEGEDLIFYGDPLFVKFDNEGTLEILAPYSSILKSNYDSHLYAKIGGLKKKEEIDGLEVNYEDLGYLKISAY